MKSIDLDDLLEETLEKICCDEFCELEDYVVEHGRHEFSDDFEKKMEALLNPATDNIQKLDVKKQKVKRPKIKYLLVAILILLMGTLTAFAYEPIRVTIQNIAYTIFHDHLLIEGENDVESTDKEYVNWKKPMYIPEGYVETLNLPDEVAKEFYLIYENEEGKVLSYIQCTSNTVSTVTSDGKNVESLRIGDIETNMTIDETGTMVIFYEKDGWIFQIAGELELEEMKKIIKNIK